MPAAGRPRPSVEDLYSSRSVVLLLWPGTAWANQVISFTLVNDNDLSSAANDYCFY